MRSKYLAAGLALTAFFLNIPALAQTVPETAAPAVQTVLLAEYAPEGDGTAENPYLADSAETLAYISERINAGDSDFAGAFYRQTAPIVLTSHIPIGTADTPFSGTYDGDGYPVTFEHVPTYTDVSYLGLFGYAQQANFLNVVVTGELSADTQNGQTLYAGLLCGFYKGTKRVERKIRGCEAIGNVTAYTNGAAVYAGSLIGCMRLDSGKTAFTDCYAEVQIVASSVSTAFVGGLCGFTRAVTGGLISYSHCAFNGSVENMGNSKIVYAGGITGYFKQDETAWLVSSGSDKAVLSEEQPQSIVYSAVKARMNVSGSSETHAGSLSGFEDGTAAAGNYVCIPGLTPSSNTLNGESVTEDTLFDRDFLTETMGFDLNGTWLALADKSGMRLVSKYAELIRTPLATDRKNILRFQPVNLEKGLFTAAFYDDSGRICAARSLSFDGKDETFHTTLPEGTNTFRVFLFSDNVSLIPLLRKPLSLTTDI